MRAARIADGWRHLREQRGHLFHLSTLSIGGAHFVNSTVQMAPGITVLAGLNGTGKSQVLDLIARATTTGHATLVVGSETVECDVTISTMPQGAPAGVIPSVITFNPVTTIADRRRSYEQDANFMDLLDGVDPNDLRAKEVNLLSHIVGKQYSRISIYEIEDTSEGADATEPFFEVSSGAATYDSRSMGLGELAVLEFYWLLKRIEPPGLVLIDEHHALVSQHTAGAILDLAAEYTGRGIGFVIATHNPGVLSRLQPAEVITCTEIGGAIHLQNIADLEFVTSVLGAQDSARAVVFVEDPGAELLLREALSIYGGGWISGIDIAVASGAGDLEKLRRHLPPKSERVSFAIVMDGDVEVVEGTTPGIETLVLPGGVAPEAYVRNAVAIDIAGVAHLTNLTEAQVVAVLGAHQGQDHHDWLIDVSVALGLSTQILVKHALVHYSKKAADGAGMAALVERIRGLTPMRFSTEPMGNQEEEEEEEE